MTDPLTDFLDSGARDTLEHEALPRFIARQRWFGGKARPIARVRFADWARIDTAGHPLFLTVVAVEYQDGSTELCHVPLTVVESDGHGALAADAVLGPVPGADSALVCDAVHSHDAMRALMHAVTSGATFPARHGQIVASADRAAHHGDVLAPIVPLPAVHSNSALTVGGRYLLKLFRRIEAGLNPDVEIGRFLERSRARVNTPALVGSVEYRMADAVATLALVQTLVPSRANAWDDALEHLETFFARARQSDAEPGAPLVRELAGPYVAAIEILGRRTAELHVALSAVSDEPDFAPALATPGDVAATAQRERLHAAGVFDLLERHQDALDADVRPLADAVLARREVFEHRIAALWADVQPFTKIRIHGDYHLGQVLCVGDDFVIIDFEGEPARSLADRRTKQSPLRDVAGMLRSFSYAAEAGLRAASADGTGRTALAAWARGWETLMSASFLEGYLRAAGSAAFVPRDPQAVRRMLDLLVLHKAFYELHYEMNNRPSWVALPLHGILRIAEPDAGQ